MKAAEDFLADQGITEETLAGDYAEVCLAMRLYSDQQNKELREKVKMWEETADRSFRSYVEENQRLTAENKELRETIDSILNKSESDQDVIIIERGFHIQRLTKENKEKEAEIQRLTKELEEEKKLRNAAIDVGQEYRQEIRELTKEVEEIRQASKFLDRKQMATITRLRELLGEAMEEISSGYMTQNGKKELLEKIDQTLKP